MMMMMMMMMVVFVKDYKMDEMAPHYAMIVDDDVAVTMLVMIEYVDMIVMFDVMKVVAVVVVEMAVDGSVVQSLRSN